MRGPPGSCSTAACNTLPKSLLRALLERVHVSGARRIWLRLCAGPRNLIGHVEYLLEVGPRRNRRCVSSPFPSFSVPPASLPWLARARISPRRNRAVIHSSSTLSSSTPSKPIRLSRLQPPRRYRRLPHRRLPPHQRRHPLPRRPPPEPCLSPRPWLFRAQRTRSASRTAATRSSASARGRARATQTARPAIAARLPRAFQVSE